MHNSWSKHESSREWCTSQLGVSGNGSRRWHSWTISTFVFSAHLNTPTAFTSSSAASSLPHTCRLTNAELSASGSLWRHQSWAFATARAAREGGWTTNCSFATPASHCTQLIANGYKLLRLTAGIPLLTLLWSQLFRSWEGSLPSWRSWPCTYATAATSSSCSPKWISWNDNELEGLWCTHQIGCWGQSSCKGCPPWPQIQALRFARLQRSKGESTERCCREEVPLPWFFPDSQHQHRSSFRCQRRTTRHIHCSRVTLSEFDCCYPSSILIASCFSLPFLAIQVISQVPKWRRRTCILWALQLRRFHWRTWQCAACSSSPQWAGLQAREGCGCPYVLVRQHPPCELRYRKALADLFTFWECFKIHSWTAKLGCLPARCIHSFSSRFIPRLCHLFLQ